MEPLRAVAAGDRCPRRSPFHAAHAARRRARAHAPGGPLRILRHLYRRSPRELALSIGAGLASGLASASLLALIHRTVSTRATAALLAGFVLLCAVRLAFGFTAQSLLVRLAQRSLAELRVRLSRAIDEAPLRQIESLGAARLQAALTDDAVAIANACASLPIAAVSTAVVLGCLAYLAWLSPILFTALLLFVMAGLVVYRALTTRARSRFEAARRETDTLFEHFRGVIHGTKELKLHRGRSAAFFEELEGSADRLRAEQSAGSTLFALANNWGHLLLFLFLGLLLFALGGAERFGPTVVTGFVLASIYLLAPLDVIMNALPFLARGNVALASIEALGLALERERDEEGVEAGEWSTISLRGITHRYHREGEDDSFTLGPVDLDIHRGELLFIAGGNGSGKTTLLKIIAGLYPPESGVVLVDGRPAARASYRALFSAVFADFHLFDQLPPNDAPQTAIASYLQQMRLDRILRIDGGRVSTTQLSTGQRKRVALMMAAIEGRDVCLFDEWAADQDPEFKEIFYRQLLPQLQREGKTIIAVTHDDRYFDAADRLLRIEDGQLRNEPLTEPFAPLVVPILPSAENALALAAHAPRIDAHE